VIERKESSEIVCPWILLEGASARSQHAVRNLIEELRTISIAQLIYKIAVKPIYRLLVIFANNRNNYHESYIGLPRYQLTQNFLRAKN